MATKRGSSDESLVGTFVWGGGQRDDFESITIGGGLTDTLTATVQQ